MLTQLKLITNFFKTIPTIVIVAFPITFLTIKHGVHVSLYSLSIIAILYWLTKSADKFAHLRNIESALVICSLLSIFAASGLTQVIRHDIYLPSFDGPSRLLFGAIVFSFLLTQPISLAKILEKAIPVGLIATLGIVIRYPETSTAWGNRFATSFVDPNTLGSQSLVLGIVSLLFISQDKKIFVNLLAILGAFCGFYLSIQAGSRGGWVALPFILISLIVIQSKQASKTPRSINKKKLLLVIFLGILSLASIFIALTKSQAIATRIVAAQSDILNLVNGNFNTSIGTRVAMWIISFKYLIPAAGISGIGEMEVKNLIQNMSIDTFQFESALYHLSYTGPHSDLLAKLISMGYIGGAAYLMTVITPLFLFIKNISNIDQDKKRAARIGFCYSIGVIICGLSNEMLSLKYLCSFYGLMIACLAADVLRDNSYMCAPNQKAT